MYPKVLSAAAEIQDSNKFYVNPVPPDPFEESVHKLIPIELRKEEKAARYKSVHAYEVKAEEKKGKKLAASMGKVNIQPNPPQEFLRKGDGNVRLIPAEVFQCDKTILRDPLPKDRGIIPKPTEKDFIKLNALENIHSIPKKTKDEGPNYKEKKDYGKVPGYLAKRITEQQNIKQQRELEYSERKIMEKRQSELERGLVPLPEEERLKILNGLKNNWERLNSDYQKLSLTVDTVPKIARKVNMEQQLKQLEEQLAKFSNSNIMVNFNSM
ncbi:hypothetical protein HK099_003407 [Clydaea vesicula]|uniref:Enkurin domain-containing protein n=1 Tax=Clydaea vesicula TaxID=447962 RepID=A0AAD5U4I1_9FUNG|nr:hypothetical protein HK099_003407 [Clydaea vesicula]